jgi:hypothetical protein
MMAFVTVGLEDVGFIVVVGCFEDVGVVMGEENGTSGIDVVGRFVLGVLVVGLLELGLLVDPLIVGFVVVGFTVVGL